MDAAEQKLTLIEGSQGGGASDKPVAVVTGAGRGIGRALSLELVRRGFRVIAVVRQLSSVRELFLLDPENIFPVRCDIKENSTESVLKEFIESQTGRVDVLVNNAGHGASGFGIEGLNIEELSDVLQVHLFGSIRCLKACVPFLKNSDRACVVNVSSRFASLEWVSTGAVPNEISTYTYRIAKASLNMLSSCLTDELKGKVRVLAVDPGKVKTRFGPNDADMSAEESAESIADLIDQKSLTGMFVHVSGEKLPW